WQAAHNRRGAGAADGHDQLRGDLRPDRASSQGPPSRRRLGVSAEALEVVRGGLAGQRAWLVGGAVRDRLLGRPLSDLDVVLDGDPAEGARAIARAAKRAGEGAACFPLSEEFGAWRVVARGGAWQVDVERLRGGSLAVELGLEPASQTLAAARAQAARLNEVSPERVFFELRRIVACPQAARGIELMSEIGATAVVLPELEAMRGVEQSRFHHRDVYGHTLEVFEYVVALTTPDGRETTELGEALGEK